MNDIRTKFAVFGVRPFRFVVVRPPFRRYGYGALLTAYLQGLRQARALSAPVFFLTRRSEPGASLASMSAEGVRVIPPLAPLRAFMWVCWGMRLAWAQARSPGRWLRLRRAPAVWIMRSIDAVIVLQAAVQRRVESFLSPRSQRLLQWIKERPGSEPLQLRQLYPKPDNTGLVDNFARVQGRAARRCRAVAVSIGIDPGRPIVTLHVREPGWRASLYGGGDRPSHRVRNASIETYRQATRYLHENGVQVIRLGDPSMSRFKAKGVYDIAHRPETDSLFELWAVANSMFMIGADSGPATLAVLTGTPLLMVNSTNLYWAMRMPRDRFICKLAYRADTREPMSLAEMVAGGHIMCTFAPSEEDDEPYRDNTEGEIRGAVMEMYDLVRRPLEEAAPTPSQLRYRELLAEHGFLKRVPGAGQICDGFARRWLEILAGPEEIVSDSAR